MTSVVKVFNAFRARPALLASFGLGLLFLLSACSDSSPAEAVYPQLQLSGQTMGTHYNITLVGDDERISAELQTGVDALLEEVNQQMSTYIPDSELNRLQQSEIGEWQDISETMAEVLAISTEVSRLSGGAFDVTLRPLIDLWGFGPTATDGQLPAPEAIASTLKGTGYQHLKLEQGRVQRQQPVSLDLSAVAKGYGVDRVADWLQQQGIDNYLVEIGGEMRVRGHNAYDQPWRIAIERPQSGLTRTVFKVLALTDMAVATSGNYRNFFVHDGVRYSHTLDPRSGYPVTHKLASVTVLHPSAAWADALATAFEVMGAEEARRLANSEGIAALFIMTEDDGLKTLASEAFEPYLATATGASQAGKE